MAVKQYCLKTYPRPSIKKFAVLLIYLSTVIRLPSYIIKLMVKNTRWIIFWGLPLCNFNKIFYLFIHSFIHLFFIVLGTEPRVSHMLAKHSTTELHSTTA